MQFIAEPTALYDTYDWCPHDQPPLARLAGPVVIETACHVTCIRIPHFMV
jgi:hypothetical protein